MLAEPNLLCCDGSDPATEAIDFAAAPFPHGTRATVLNAWEPTAVAASGGLAPVAIAPDSDEQDEARAKRLVVSLLPGSCSHHVAKHAASPVLIVPGAELGDARRPVRLRERNGIPTPSPPGGSSGPLH